MKKLKLNVDSLNVESFRSAGEQPAPRGTVQGHQPTVNSTCQCYTIEISCGATCGPYASCWEFC